MKIFKNLKFGYWFLVLGVVFGCNEKPKLEQPVEKTPVEQVPVEEPSVEKPKLTVEELEEMAAHENRAGFGMSFYYDELRRRNDREWAKKELERRTNQ